MKARFELGERIGVGSVSDVEPGWLNIRRMCCACASFRLKTARRTARRVANIAIEIRKAHGVLRRGCSPNEKPGQSRADCEIELRAETRASNQTVRVGSVYQFTFSHFFPAMRPFALPRFGRSASMSGNTSASACRTHASVAPGPRALPPAGAKRATRYWHYLSSS